MPLASELTSMVPLSAHGPVPATVIGVPSPSPGSGPMNHSAAVTRAGTFAAVAVTVTGAPVVGFGLSWTLLIVVGVIAPGRSSAPISNPLPVGRPPSSMSLVGANTPAVRLEPTSIAGEPALQVVVAHQVRRLLDRHQRRVDERRVLPPRRERDRDVVRRRNDGIRVAVADVVGEGVRADAPAGRSSWSARASRSRPRAEVPVLDRGGIARRSPGR